MIRSLLKRLDPRQLFDIQRVQYRDTIVLPVVIPSGTTVLGRANIGALGHFYCLAITGQFETLRDDPGAPGTDIDDGINHIRATITDSAGNRRLTNDFVPLSLLLSPGRRRSVAAANAIIATATAAVSSAPQQLFYPFEFEYLFASNSDILMEFQSDTNATAATHVDVCFHGIRILSSESVTGLRAAANRARR